MIKNLKVKKLLSKSNSTVIVGDSTVKHSHGKPIANKTNNDNINLVKPFLGARTKAMKHEVSPDLKTRPTYSTYWHQRP